MSHDNSSCTNNSKSKCKSKEINLSTNSKMKNIKLIKWVAAGR